MGGQMSPTNEGGRSTPLPFIFYLVYSFIQSPMFIVKISLKRHYIAVKIFFKILILLYNTDLKGLMFLGLNPGFTSSSYHNSTPSLILAYNKKNNV